MFPLNQFHNAGISGNLLKLIGMKFRKVSTIASQIISLIKMYVFFYRKMVNHMNRMDEWMSKLVSVECQTGWLRSEKFQLTLFSIYSKKSLLRKVVFEKAMSKTKPHFAVKILKALCE